MTQHNTTQADAVRIDDSPCKSLSGRRREICLGTANGVDQRLRRSYVEAWMADGRLTSDPDVPPGIVRRAMAYCGKIFRFLRSFGRHAADGFGEATDDIQDKRRAICGGCPEFNKAGSECHVCGCNLRIKTQWRTSQCPMGKW